MLASSSIVLTDQLGNFFLYKKEFLDFFFHHLCSCFEYCATSIRQKIFPFIFVRLNYLKLSEYRVNDRFLNQFWAIDIVGMKNSAIDLLARLQ